MASRGKQSSIRRGLSSGTSDVARTFGELESVGDVIADDSSAAGVKVGFGNVVRVQALVDTYVAFGDENIVTVTILSTPAVKILAGEFVHILATDDYMRSSAAFTRVEVIHI